MAITKEEKTSREDLEATISAKFKVENYKEVYKMSEQEIMLHAVKENIQWEKKYGKLGWILTFTVLILVLTLFN